MKYLMKFIKVIPLIADFGLLSIAGLHYWRNEYPQGNAFVLFALFRNMIRVKV